MAQNAWRKTTELSRRREILMVEQPMTLRQLFYRLVSVEQLANSRADYQRLSQSCLVPAGREDPLDWIVDAAVQYAPIFDNAQEYLGAVSRDYRRDY